MAPSRVIKHFDVIEHIAPGSLPCWVYLPFNSLTFEKLKEAFGHSIIMAVATPAHAPYKTIGFQEALPVAAAELAPLDALLSVKWILCFG